MIHSFIDMTLIHEGHVQFDRVRSSDGSEIQVRARHVPTGITVVRSVAADASEDAVKADLLAALSEEVVKRFRPEDIRIDHIWCGPGKGAALRIVHLPTGVSMQREIGYDPPDLHRPELMSLFLERLMKSSEH